MYSWSCLFITLTAIYAYRFCKNKEVKDLIIFGIFSIASMYIHYYALITTFLINVFVLIFLSVRFKECKKDLIKFIILGTIQVILYIPWLVYLLGQIDHVNSGFWIYINAIKTTVEILGFQFKRQLDTDFAFNISTISALISACLLYIYLIYLTIKNMKQKENMKPGILSALVYISVILIIYIISKIKQPILYSRYLMVMTGLYIFTFAYIMSKEKRKWITISTCTLILTLGIISNITNITINYDKNNQEFVDYIKNEIKEDDILIYSNIGNGGVVAALFPNNTQYFYNGAYWDVEEAYKAYGPGMKTIYNYNDVLENYKGRIWLIDSDNLGLFDEIPKENTKVIKEPRKFVTKYHDYVYGIVLIEKE